MNVFYELMDIDTGNVVGFYASRDEALSIVRSAFDRYGEPGIADLSLSFQDETGEMRLVAEGVALGELAMSTALRRSA
jgi:hypothetical protein